MYIHRLTSSIAPICIQDDIVSLLGVVTTVLSRQYQVVGTEKPLVSLDCNCSVAT